VKQQRIPGRRRPAHRGQSCTLGIVRTSTRPPKYAKGVEGRRGGQAGPHGQRFRPLRPMRLSHFITSYEESCSGKQLTYTANGSGAGSQDVSCRQDRFRRFGLNRCKVTRTPPPSSAAEGPMRGTCRCRLRVR